MSEYNVKKSQATVYQFREKGTGFNWADITITEGETRGFRIQIASDYGDWQYFWGAPGGGWRKFLTTITKEYVADKFGEDEEFNLEATLKSIRSCVAEDLEEGNIEPDYHKELLEEIETLENDCGDHKDSFYHLVYSECPKLEELQPNTVTKISHLFERFWNEVWQEFKMILTNELETEEE